MKIIRHIIIALLISVNLYGQDTIFLKNSDNIEELTKKGNKVYIDSDDKGIISHVSYEIGKWGYWVIVKDVHNADFILRFNCQNGLFYGKGFVEFFTPSNEELLLKLYQPPGMVINMNSKKGNIRRFISETIIPQFDSEFVSK